jgi:hypothetical protein
MIALVMDVEIPASSAPSAIGNSSDSALPSKWMRIITALVSPSSDASVVSE